VSQPLLSGLSNILHRRDIVMAKIEESVTSLEYYNTVCATILKAVQSYFALMAEQNQAKLRETSLDYAKKQLATIEALVKKKFENNEKLLQYKAKVLEREIDNYAVQASLQQQLANFLQLVDQMENSQVVRLTTDPMEPVALDRERLPSLLDSSLARRIDFRRAEQNLDRAKLNLTMAQSATLPNLALNGTYYMYGTDPEFGRTFAKIQSQSYNDFKVGMSFSMPIDKDYRRSQLTPLTIAVNDMEFQKKSLARSIRQELQGAVARLELNARQYASTCSAVMVADLNSAEALKLYENGFMRFDDYLDQLKNKEASRNQQLKSRIEYTNSYYSLRQSQGLLLESFSLEIK
jgi:outer membrane protein TolC